jgi:hypothetical protein
MVNELVPLNVFVPLCVHVIPDPSVMPPDILRTDDPARVPVYPVVLRFKHEAVAVIVTVTAPLLASKNTSSDDVGTAWSPVPPEVSDHFEPAVPSQFAVPPTQ